MAKCGLYIISLLMIFSCLISSDSTTPTNFIKSACQVTHYPALCVRTLSAFNIQTEKQLAQAALAVSLAKARAFTLFVSNISNSWRLNPRESQALNDCIDNMGNAMGQLIQSIHELDRARGLDFDWHMSNVETWSSTALTNENTCIDGFMVPGTNGSVKVVIKWRITGVVQTTSNALALVNRYASKKGGRLP